MVTVRVKITCKLVYDMVVHMIFPLSSLLNDVNVYGDENESR
jgi:hypothetical protein